MTLVGYLDPGAPEEGIDLTMVLLIGGGALVFLLLLGLTIYFAVRRARQDTPS